MGMEEIAVEVFEAQEREKRAEALAWKRLVLQKQEQDWVEI